MNVVEMKKELISEISNVENETVLKEVLALLKKANGTVESAISLSRNYDAIKEQYGDVLQKLAQ